MLGILDLLALRGYDRKKPAKLVRHKSPKDDVQDLLRRGWFDAYQSHQRLPVFDGCESIVSFIGTEGTKALFVGVYRVTGRRAGSEGKLPPGCPHTEWLRDKYFYDLVREPGYEDLERRVIIDWGKGARAWLQRVSNKEVVEILPKGQFLTPFRDYLEFTLTRTELVDLFAHEDANREWRARLSAVAGIYLILATTTGNQYVGSAYGTDGIWGRWATYARDASGGNVLLRKLIDTDPAYPDAFSYSILQILPKTFARDEVIGWERRYKQKLGSRATGLNSN